MSVPSHVLPRSHGSLRQEIKQIRNIHSVNFQATMPSKLFPVSLFSKNFLVFHVDNFALIERTTFYEQIGAKFGHI